ncbi:MAG: hypothetical protein F6K30_03185 [Cyanothece sp. SIO2G6]|nr:hypothetical protein [Cyanothece sp. SIO2G6]
MTQQDYFYESMPDGIAIAIQSFDPDLECCGQEGYELLVMTFGTDVNGNHVKTASEADYAKFAKSMAALFELEQCPSIEDAKAIMQQALQQWGG